MSCSNSPMKVFANSEPAKVISGGMGVFKVASTAGCDHDGDMDPSPGIAGRADSGYSMQGGSIWARMLK